MVIVVQSEVCFSRWWMPPSWISKNCWHFFSIWRNVTKICGNIGTYIWNKLMMSEMHIGENSRWRSPPSWNSKNGCHFFTIWPIIAELRGILLFWFKIHRRRRKILVTLIQVSVNKPPSVIAAWQALCRHLWFRKTVAISLQFGQSSPNLVGILILWFKQTGDIEKFT